MGNGEAPACFSTAQAGQTRVEEYNVGARLVYQLGELLGGAALADNLEIGLGLKDCLYAFADDLVIVDDENPDHGGLIGSGMLALTTSPASSPLVTEKLPPRSVTICLMWRSPKCR